MVVVIAVEFSITIDVSADTLSGTVTVLTDASYTMVSTVYVVCSWKVIPYSTGFVN